MRVLSNNELELLEHRKAGFDVFLEERMPILVDFAERLSIEKPYEIIINPARFIRPIDSFMANQAIDSDDRTWILTRIGYLIGEWFVQKLDGCWKLNSIPDSIFFARYVISDFSGVNNPNAMADPFSIAEEYIDSPPPRNLDKLLNSVVDDLMAL